MTAEAFWSRVERAAPNECWLWQKHLDQDGYGQTSWHGKTVRAHRVAWRLANGSEPRGLVCHSCDNPPCVNPAHLWVGTHQDNMLDKAAKGRGTNGNTAVTRCPQGHEYTAENTYSHGGSRNCRACNRAAVAAYKRRKKS